MIDETRKARPEYSILIAGLELAEIKKHTWSMPEAFGLDRRIEKYRGIRPIDLYSWDMDCLDDVISMALNDPNEYPVKSDPGYQALANLYERLKSLRDGA